MKGWIFDLAQFTFKAFADAHIHLLTKLIQFPKYALFLKRLNISDVICKVFSQKRPSNSQSRANQMAFCQFDKRRLDQQILITSQTKHYVWHNCEICNKVLNKYLFCWPTVSNWSSRKARERPTVATWVRSQTFSALTNVSD